MRNFLKFILLLFFLTIFISCQYKVKINIEPQDSSINIDAINFKYDYAISGKILKLKDRIINIAAYKEGYEKFSAKYKNILFKTNVYNIKLNKRNFEININVDEGTSKVYFNNHFIGFTPLKYKFQCGIKYITLKRYGYADQICMIDVKEDSDKLFHHHKESVLFAQVGIYKCGNQPKQVIFSPDEKYLAITLLDGIGFDLFDMGKQKLIGTMIPTNSDVYIKKGFVEGVFSRNNNSFFISQMTTSEVHQFSYPGFDYIKSINTGGLWSKFIALSEKLNLIAVSNWSSDSVSIIDITKWKIIKIIKTTKIPRGIVFTKDGKYLIVTTFGGGRISLFDTSNWTEIKYIDVKNAALRHAVLNKDDTILYVSDMRKSKIYEINMTDFKITHIFDVDKNPNTIDISSDGKYLAISCRGPNNSESYLKRSPINGKIIIIDLLMKKEVARFTSGNQPTGLDFSDSGKYLAISNFMDNTIEIFYCAF